MNLTEQVFKIQMGPRSGLLININQTFHIYYQNFDVCGMRIRLCLSMLYWHLYSWQKHGDALQQVVWSPLQQHLLPQKRISLAQKGIDRKSQNLKQIWCEFMGKDGAKEVGLVEVVHAPIKTIARMREKLGKGRPPPISACVTYGHDCLEYGAHVGIWQQFLWCFKSNTHLCYKGAIFKLYYDTKSWVNLEIWLKFCKLISNSKLGTWFLDAVYWNLRCVSACMQ